MSKIPAMPFFPADFFADTAHISGEAAGIYLLMLAHAWMSDGGQLPDDEDVIVRMLRLNKRRWKAVKNEVMPFWTPICGYSGKPCFINKRLTKDRQNIDEKVTINRANGALGGRPKFKQNSFDFNSSGKPNGYNSLNPNETKSKGNQNQNQNLKDSFNSGRQERGWIPTKLVGGRRFKAGEYAPAYEGQDPKNWKMLTVDDCS